MPIAVLCPGCKARFSVSEKFAGKKGPCPKCKVVITIPDAPAEEVQVHVPEEYASGGKDTKGRALSKPIARVETRLQPTAIVAIIGASLATLMVALVLRGLQDKTLVIAIGLLLTATPLAIAGYAFLRDDELEPYRGRALLLRATLCGLVYVALWGAYFMLPADFITGEAWQWLFIAPICIAIGAGTSFATLDLDFGSAAMHYCFYLLATLLLRAAIGLPPLWAATTQVAA